MSSSASAATIVVNTKADERAPGDRRCSLREAIDAVNAPNPPSADCGAVDATANVIKLPAGKQVLARHGADEDGNVSGDLDIGGVTTNITIQGAGETRTKIDATGLGDRVLTAAGGPTVRLSGITITGGHAPDGAAGMDAPPGANGGAGQPGESGGAVMNSGKLILVHTRVTGNQAGSGGVGGKAQFDASSNSFANGGNGGAGGGGGGIFNSGRLTVIQSTIGGNRAGDGGRGGQAAKLLHDNGGTGGAGAAGGSGGGVDDDPGATLKLIASTISGNYAGNGGPGGTAGPGNGGYPGGNGGAGGTGGNGGGIFSDSGTVSATNGTAGRNFAGSGGAGARGGVGDEGSKGGNGGDGGNGGWGGAVFAFGGPVSLIHVTVTQNAAGPGGSAGAGGPPGGTGSVGTPGGNGASGIGGGIAESFGSTTLQNTIVASDGLGGNCSAVGLAEIADGGHNLVFGDATCPGVVRDPKLGPLAENGGPTKTVALGRFSAARDKVPASGSGCPGIDQRGLHRPQGKACDIGAFEFATPRVEITSPRDGARYKRGKRVLAAFRCTEGGSRVFIRSCRGTVRNGKPINTSSSGKKSFTVTATDLAGLRVSKTVHYTAKKKKKKQPH